MKLVFFKKLSIMIYSFIFLLSVSIGRSQEFFNQQIFFVNNLVEQDGEYVRPFTNEPVVGDLYQYFIYNNQRSDKVFVGIVTKKGKQGYWTRYWSNGNKKDEGYFINSEKDGLWVEWMEDGRKYAEIFYEKDIVQHLTNCIIENCD